MTRAPIKRHGGKSYQARHIASLLPPHDAYNEPFCGSAAVLFAKEPSAVEFISDADRGVVAVFAMLRDRFCDFHSELEALDYSQGVFERWRDTPADSLDDLNLAIRTYVVCNMSRGGLGEDFAWSDRLRGGRPGDLNAWLTKLGMLSEMSDRLEGVFVAHGNAFRSITTRTTSVQGESDRRCYAVATGRPQRLGKVAVAFFSIVRGGCASATKKLCQTAAEAACYS